MPDEKLLPCPFCGGEAEFDRYGTSRMSTIVSCTECGGLLENGATFDHGRGWNKRSYPPAVQSLITAARAYRDDMRRIEAGEIEATDTLAALEEAAMKMEEG